MATVNVQEVSDSRKLSGFQGLHSTSNSVCKACTMNSERAHPPLTNTWLTVRSC